MASCTLWGVRGAAAVMKEVYLPGLFAAAPASRLPKDALRFAVILL